jgi:hypothetical protein
MNADLSLKLFDLTYEFIKDKAKAQEFISKLEQTIDSKFHEKENGLASKQDIHALKEDMTKLELKIAEAKTDMIKWYVVLFVLLALMIIGLYFK